MMKKKAIFCVGLTIVLLLALCACGQSGDTSDETAQEYRLVAGETLDVNDEIFDKPVEVYVDASSTADNQSSIQFTNCTFAKGLTIIGDRSGWVRLFDGCSFGNNSFITVKEATEGSMKTGKLEDDFLKLYLDQPNIKVETTALLNTISRQDVTINGTKYKMADFPDCNIFCAAYYYDNDEITTYTEGWTEED